MRAAAHALMPIAARGRVDAPSASVAHDPRLLLEPQCPLMPAGGR